MERANVRVEEREARSRTAGEALCNGLLAAEGGNATHTRLRPKRRRIGLIVLLSDQGARAKHSSREHRSTQNCDVIGCKTQHGRHRRPRSAATPGVTDNAIATRARAACLRARLRVDVHRRLFRLLHPEPAALGPGVLLLLRLRIAPFTTRMRKSIPNFNPRTNLPRSLQRCALGACRVGGID